MLKRAFEHCLNKKQSEFFKLIYLINLRKRIIRKIKGCFRIQI